MAVLLPDGRYRLIRHEHPWSRDSHGLPVLGSAASEATAWMPGALVTRPGGGSLIRLDPTLWPVSTGDVIEREDDIRTWTVTEAPQLVEVPGTPDVDHVRVPVVVTPPKDPERGYPTAT